MYEVPSDGWSWSPAYSHGDSSLFLVKRAGSTLWVFPKLIVKNQTVWNCHNKWVDDACCICRLPGGLSCRPSLHTPVTMHHWHGSTKRLRSCETGTQERFHSLMMFDQDYWVELCDVVCRDSIPGIQLLFSSSRTMYSVWICHGYPWVMYILMFSFPKSFLVRTR